MVHLIIKNSSVIDSEYRDQFTEICNEKLSYYENLFKKYSKDLTLEVIVKRSNKIYSVSVSLDLKSKKVLLAEEDKDILKATHSLFAELKKAVKRQYEMERKDYEYKRKNRK